jgi:hypothetical protein
VRRFLRECAVPPSDIERALELAADITASAGSALLRVELGGQGGAVTVTTPASQAAPVASPPQGANADPLLRAPELVSARAIQARALA